LNSDKNHSLSPTNPMKNLVTILLITLALVLPSKGAADVTLSLSSSNQLRFATNWLYTNITSGAAAWAAALTSATNRINNYNTNKISVLDYGAIPDNSTDNQLTLSNAWNASSGKTLYFPPGRYKTSRLNLTTTRNNLNIEGYGATIVAANSNLFSFLPTGTNHTYRGITFDNDFKVGTSVYYNPGSRNIAFIDCKFLNGYLDMGNDPAGTGYASGILINRNMGDITFINCTISNYNISLTGNNGRLVKGINIAAFGGTFPGHEIQRINILGNFFYNINVPQPYTEGDSLEISFPNGGFDYECNVIGNLFSGYTWRGIKAQFHGINITGNIFNSKLTGADTNLSAISMFGRGIIANNIINGNHTKAIDTSTTGTNNAATNLVIIGNEIYSNGRTDTNMIGIKIKDGTTNAIVANNVIDGYTFAGIGVNGAAQNIRVVNNIITHNGTGIQGILVDNRGQVTSDSPTRLFIQGNSVDGYTNGIVLNNGTIINTLFNNGSVSGTFISRAGGVTGLSLYNGTFPSITTATLDFGSIASQTSEDLTISVTGAAVGDPVNLSLPAAPTAGISFNAFVSATDTVTVRANNYTGGPIDPVSASYTVQVVKQ
jgi:hypothetical protein